MKQFIYKGFWILAIVFIIDIAVGFISDRIFFNLPDKTTLMANIYQSLFKKKADVLILGPSTATHHYNPLTFEDRLGLSVYNAGLDGHGIIYQDIVLQSMMDRTDLKIVILDIGDVQLNGYWMTANSDLNPYYKKNCHVSNYIDKETSWQQRLKLKSSLYRYNKTLSYLIRIIIDKPNITKGYLPLEGRADSLTEHISRVFNPDPLDLSHFDNVINTCKNRGVSLFLIQSPSYDVNEAFDKWIIEYCKKRSVVLINENNNPYYKQHPDYFRDERHMNGNGAESFSENIASSIKNEITF